MVNIYQFLKGDPKINKLVGDEYLFAEYKCPIETENFQFMTDRNFFTYVITGRKDWYASGKLYTLGPGDAVFVRKGAYTTRQYFDVDHCVLTFFITDDFIREFVRDNSVAGSSGKDTMVNEQIFQIEVSEALRALFYSMYSYLTMGRDIPRTLVEIKFKELLFGIMLDPNNSRLSRFLSSVQRGGKRVLEEIMMKNFHFDLELDEYARMCGRSLSTFKRDFKTFYRQTPGKWLAERRLEYAKTLLISSDMNVNEICYESGFKNSSHFNKAFKDRYRLPPRQFREKSREYERIAS